MEVLMRKKNARLKSKKDKLIASKLNKPDLSVFKKVLMKLVFC